VAAARQSLLLVAAAAVSDMNFTYQLEVFKHDFSKLFGINNTYQIP
jgi:hypothetical protein